MTQLLATLEREVSLLLESGSSTLHRLTDYTDTLLQKLRDVELELELEVEREKQSDTQIPEEDEVSLDSIVTDTQDSIDFGLSLKLARSLRLTSRHKQDSMEYLAKCTSGWYSDSISCLKTYNGQILRFLKNIVNNSKFRVDLNDAYNYPLDLTSNPAKGASDTVAVAGFYDAAEVRKQKNREDLTRSIMVHFLRLGYGSCLGEILEKFGLTGRVQAKYSEQLKQLGLMVEDIKVRHDLSKALQWAEARDDSPTCKELLFRLNMLQYILILKGNTERDSINSGTNSDSSLKALSYATVHFPRHFSYYADEIAPLMTLLLFKQPEESNKDKTLKDLIYRVFVQGIRNGSLRNYQRKFVAEILRSFGDIHGNQRLFENIASKLSAEYCADIGLSNDSSLFEALLSGFVNLPSFYKYSRLQLKLGTKASAEANPEENDLPFQLPDKNRFLFSHHPIFICPVSKEQLMPLTTDEEPPKKKMLSFRPTGTPEKNPVVVFEWCHHMALKESVRTLLRGSDRFKCHYCYKKHKMLEVKDAYFIDM